MLSAANHSVPKVNLLADPFRGRLDFGSRRVAGVLSPAPRQPADDTHFHIVITSNLTTEADSGQASRMENVSLGNAYAVRFSSDEFDAAGRAPCISAAGMELIDTSILLKSQHESLAQGHFKLPHTFHG